MGWNRNYLSDFVMQFYTPCAWVKFIFSKKATKIDKIFTVDLMVTTYCQIDGEYFVNFWGLLRKRELYQRPMKPLKNVD